MLSRRIARHLQRSRYRLALLTYTVEACRETERSIVCEREVLNAKLPRAVMAPVLGFLEPDMQVLPVREVPGLTSSLQHLRLHKDVCESLFDPPQIVFAPLWHSAIVCSRLGTTSTFVMDRVAPEGNVSGWFFGCGDEGH